jgi:hypothetical protein
MKSPLPKRPRTDVSPTHVQSTTLQPSVPIHRLANELLSHIFTLVVHDSGDRYDAILYPIILSHVVRRWRHIAMSTSILWTSIILTHPSPWSQLSRTVAYLSRSHRRPLDIFLDFRDPSWNWQEDQHSFGWKHMENVIRLLSPHVSRWRNLELFTDTWSPIFTFLWYLRKVQSAPMLESISLSRCNIYFASRGEVFRPVALKQSIPLLGGGEALKRLRKVVLAGVHVDWSNSGLRDLVELELKYHAIDVMPSLVQFVDILTGCPDLERLSILGWGPRFDTVSTKVDHDVPSLHVGNLRRTIRLPRVKHFVLGFLDVEYAIELLSLFCLPVLEGLILEDISATLHPSDRQDANPILEFLTKSYTSACPSASHSSSCCTTRCYPLSDIRTLELRAVQANRSTLTRFFQQFISLQRLSITNMDCAVVEVLGHDTTIQPTPSGGQNTVRSLCPALADIICSKVDPGALLDSISQSEGMRRVLSTRNISLDIRGADSDIDGNHRVAFLNAGITLLTDSILPRRPSILPLPQHQEVRASVTETILEESIQEMAVATH